MAYTMEVTGMAELTKQLEKLGKKGEQIASQGLYKGAGVAADAVSQAVQGIATEPFFYATGGKTRKPSPEEKAIIVNARRGVARFHKTGFSVETNVGIRDGYANITWNHARSGGRTKYKVGYNGKATRATSTEGKSSGRSAKPVYVIANAINSGTSFMQKQPFFRKATNKKGAADAAMENEIRNRLDELSLD